MIIERIDSPADVKRLQREEIDVLASEIRDLLVSTCAVIWRPVKLPAGAKTLARGQAKTKLLGSDADPAGGPGRHLRRLAALYLHQRQEFQ